MQTTLNGTAGIDQGGPGAVGQALQALSTEERQIEQSKLEAVRLARCVVFSRLGLSSLLSFFPLAMRPGHSRPGLAGFVHAYRQTTLFAYPPP